MFGAKLLNDRLRTRALVTLKSGEAFDGVLWDVDKQVVVLRNAAMVGVHGGAPTAVDGEVVVFLADVAYVQVG